MTSTPPRGEAASKFDLLVPWMGGLIAALPILLLEYPPMNDFAHHEALVGLLRFFDDASLLPQGVYVKNFGHPNQLFHYLAWPLSYVVPVTLACRIVVFVNVLVAPYAASRLARHLEAQPAISLIIVPFMLGWLFLWGLVSNLLGLVILVWALPALDRFVRAPSFLGALVSVLTVVLLYAAHELMMFVYIGASFVFLALRPFDARKTLTRLVPGFAGAVMAVVQVVLQEPLKTDAAKRVPNSFLPLATNLRWIPSTISGGVDASIRAVVVASLFATVVVFAMSARKYRPQLPTSVGDSRLTAARTWLDHHRFAVLGSGTFVLYLVAPFTFNSAMLVNQRFLAPAFIVLAMAIARGGSKGRPSAAVRVLPLVLPLLAVFYVLPWFADAARAKHDIEGLLESVPKNTSIATLDLDRDQGGRPYAITSQASRILFLKGGRVLYSFTDATVSPVVIARRYQWNEVTSRVMVDGYQFRPRHDLRRFRFLLVHGSHHQRLLLLRASLQPDAVFVAESGEWMLFESTLDVVPLDSPDEPLPARPPATLLARMQNVEDAAKRRHEAETRGEAPGPNEPQAPRGPSKE